MHTSGFPEMGRCALKSKLEFHLTSGVGSRSVQSSLPREEEIKLQTSASFPRISVLDPFHLPLIVTPHGSDRPRSFSGDLGASGGLLRWINTSLRSWRVKPKDIKQIPVLSMKRCDGFCGLSIYLRFSSDLKFLLLNLWFQGSFCSDLPARVKKKKKGRILIVFWWLGWAFILV